MMLSKLAAVALCTTVLLVPGTSWAQKGDLTHDHPAAPSATVGFGVLATAPLGPPPCLQSGAIGGPADPCAYKIHQLTPEEVTVFKGGEVTFHVHGGGHSIAIYEVSKDTTRDEVGQYLCPGQDPSTIGTPEAHTCNLSAANAGKLHDIADGHGDVVIVAAENLGSHPTNRVWYEPGRLMSAGQIFLPNDQLITYGFQKTGRYLVICMNRAHFLNDWMFGFVNVVGGQ
jgi:hypothetical protein